jgi:hypothetical protein
MITLLPGLQHSFSTIGLSETRIKVDRHQLINTAIPDYTLSQPTVHEAGGVGLYI